MSSAMALREVCELLTSGDEAAAVRTLGAGFPARPASTPRAHWTPTRLARLFVRDGFTDRYSGDPLVFPGTLRALTVLMPDLFPYHPNWRQSHIHPAYWTLYPTIDHVVPVARGGEDAESNVVTTSMLRNAAKGNWLLRELAWPEVHAPVVANWDGLLPWFCREYDRRESLRQRPYLRTWYAAARRIG